MFHRIASIATLITVLLALVSITPVYTPPTYAVAPGGSVGVSGRLGMDKCAASTASTMQTWWTNSPFWEVGIYIGGANRACTNVNLSASWVSQVYDQGWSFMPLWVGPQAPCSGFATKISTNTQTAATQGTNEANAAVSAAKALGFTKGTIIYYDIEAYNTSNSACHQSVDAFLSAWVARLRAVGNQAGIYGSSCGSDATSWIFTGNIPNDVWLAAWDNRATVLGISCVDDGFWNQHQRIHQYKAPHDETWGGIKLTILSDCAEGLVAGRAYDDGIPNNC